MGPAAVASQLSWGQRGEGWAAAVGADGWVGSGAALRGLPPTPSRLQCSRVKGLQSQRGLQGPFSPGAWKLGSRDVFQVRESVGPERDVEEGSLAHPRQLNFDHTAAPLTLTKYNSVRKKNRKAHCFKKMSVGNSL